METTFNFEQEQTELSKFHVHANDIIPMNEAVICQGDTRLFSLGDISVITGQPKSRKTFLVSGLIAAYLSENGYMGLSSSTVGNVLFIDTEQSRSHVLLVSRRIFRILNWDFEDKHYNDLRILSLRELGALERLKVTEKAINEYRPKLVIIDGFADLLRDTNSLEESTQRVSDLMRISSEYKCHICSVVHTNPNSEKMRGHVGSELQRKAESVLLVTKADEITTVSPQFCRNLEFKKLSFRIDNNGLPVACDYVPSVDDNNRILYESIFMSVEKMTYAGLKNEVKRRLNIKDTAAENRIKKGVEADILVKDKNSIYTLKYEEDTDEMPY
jgi:hypothetical protein